MNTIRKLVFLAAAATTIGTACGPLPAVPPYPYYSNTNKGATADVNLVNAQAQQMSDALYAYIDGWFKGQNPALIPASLIPNGADPGITDYTLIPESAIDPNTQWGSRPASYAPIDWNNAIGQFPDPHVTYGLVPHMLAPFGTKVIIEGEFPHARYFSLQPSPAFFAPVYRYNGFGSGEVAFVDADIDPLPGHVNPFRVGANRNATNRSYRVECTMVKGDPTALDPGAWTSPSFRQSGNSRACSGIQFRGPWGDAAWDAQDPAHSGDGRGIWDVGSIWMRYYAPDNGVVPYAGVQFPRITYQLPDGRRFFVNANLTKFIQDANLTGPIPATGAQDPTATNGPGVGWNKQWGIFRAIAEGYAREYGWYLPFGGINNTTPQRYVNDLDIAAMGRGASQPAHGKLEPHATAAVHINYLVRGMCLNTGKVMVFSGQLPTFPNTRGGQATATAAQSRYWSITGYTTTLDVTKPLSPTNIPGQLLTSIMDDELVLDAQRRYVLVYSRAADRPSNATAANGVTWKEFGPQGCQAFTLRWMSIPPEWSFAKAPDAAHLGWNSSWASPNYDINLIGKNNRSGFLGAYQPIVSYVTKAQFQGYGATGIFGKLPAY